jgi:hypothetical protein
MSKVYRYVKNGGIEFLDDDVKENGFFAKDSDGWKHVKTSELDILPYVKTPQDAIEEGLLYIDSFFPQWQLQDLTALISLGTSAQRSKIAEVYQWIGSLKLAAFKNPESFVPNGDPPYTYAQIIGDLK